MQLTVDRPRVQETVLPKRSTLTVAYWCHFCMPTRPDADFIVDRICDPCCAIEAWRLESK
jgi:hypothetical protein